MTSLVLSIPAQMVSFDELQKPEFTRRAGGTLIKMASCQKGGEALAGGYDSQETECCRSLVSVHINENATGFYAGSVRIWCKRSAQMRARLVLLRMDPAERQRPVVELGERRRSAPLAPLSIAYTQHPFPTGTTLSTLRNGDGVGLLGDDDALLSWSVFTIPQQRVPGSHPLDPMGAHPLGYVVKHMATLTTHMIEESISASTDKEYAIRAPLALRPAAPVPAAAATPPPPSPMLGLFSAAIEGLLLLKRASHSSGPAEQAVVEMGMSTKRARVTFAT
jgi:hypothetical protein